MLHGPLAKKIFMFALPLAASSILQQLFNAADLAVVGRFTNPQAMAAVGSNASVIGLLVNLFVGLSVGANVLIATLVGRGERSQIPDAVHTIITLALIAGITILILGIFLARPILTLMGAPQEVIDLATLYLRIYFCGMPVIMIYNYGSAILRSRGDSKRPFFSLTLAGVLNVLMNLLFVIVFKLHVIGVALATVLSNCVSAGLILYFLIKETDEFHLDLRRLKIRKDHLLRVVRIGLPAGLQTTVFSLSNVVIQSAINSFGTACIAGMTASQNFDFISYCMANSFAQAAVTFTSQNYGARNAKRCRQVWAWSMCMGIGIDMILIAIMMLLRGQLIRIFTTDTEVIRYAMVRFQIVILLHFICGSYEISGGALRGLNRSMVPALISVLGTCAFRLLYVGVWFPQHRSLETLLLVYPFSWIVTSIAMQTAYFIVRKRAFRETA
ncbi:MAG: MATE family efflux transporter [Clostridiales bacterium]|nr:MATE family efflux transporter [Clostridiales bacterium]